MTDAETKAIKELISTCERVIAWLDRKASDADKHAKEALPRWPGLAETYESTARDFRATSADLRKAIKKSGGSAESMKIKRRMTMANIEVSRAWAEKVSDERAALRSALDELTGAVEDASNLISATLRAAKEILQHTQ